MCFRWCCDALDQPLAQLEHGNTHVKGHPTYRLVLWDVGLLDELQGELLVVKGDGDDDARRGPGPAHEMMLDHGECAASGGRRMQGETRTSKVKSEGHRFDSDLRR